MNRRHILGLGPVAAQKSGGIGQDTGGDPLGQGKGGWAVSICIESHQRLVRDIACSVKGHGHPWSGLAAVTP